MTQPPANDNYEITRVLVYRTGEPALIRPGNAEDARAVAEIIAEHLRGR